VYALGSFLLSCIVTIGLFWENPDRLRGAVDFPAFYNAGRIINEYQWSELYDRDLQERLYIELLPSTPLHDSEIRLFSYTPFIALLFAPFARLTYLVAFICWAIFSFGLYRVGFQFACRASGLEKEYWNDAFLISLGFTPLIAWCLLSGQTSTIAFFALAASIYLDHKENYFYSGLSLSLLAYKPQLLILFIPMLIVTGRWKTLIGIIVGDSMLAGISLAILGPQGFQKYLAMLKLFAALKANGLRITNLEVDAYTFFFRLVANRAAWLFILLSVIVVPILIVTWRRNRAEAWATAITWTLILNFYVLLYDSSLVILAVLLTVAQRGITKDLKALLITLFLIPWFHTFAAKHGIQVVTLVLFAFGCYQLWLLAHLNNSHVIHPKLITAARR